MRIAAAMIALSAFWLLTDELLAQQLPKLHVGSVALRADTARPQIERPFHLIIAAHFKEQLASADFLVLPVLNGLENLGDERHVLAAPRGTDFTETMTVVAHRARIIHVGSAYLDAIDARDGKPKRFYSNDLTLTVIGTAARPLEGLQRLRRTLLRLVLVLLAVFVVAWLLLRPRKRIAPQTPPAAAPVALPSELDELRGRLQQLKAQRSRPAVMRLRAQLWRMAGVPEGETLNAALGRLGVREPALHPVLRLAERAAFIQEAYLQGAIDDVIFAMERYLS